MEKISNKNFIEELIVENVNFSFGFKEILKDINFTLKKGEVVSIVGPSGGGKTTLLHLCSKLLKLDTGRIKNSFLSSTFAFQEPRLLPWKNVIDNISLALKAKGEKTNIAEQKAKDIAILFRVNALSRSLEEGFNKAGLNYKLVGGMKFYERTEIKDLIAYFRILTNLSDNFSIKRVINKPKRGIGATTIDKLEEKANELNSSIFDMIQNLNADELSAIVGKKNARTIKVFEASILDLRELMNQSKMRLLDSFEETFDYRASYDNLPDGFERQANIDEFYGYIRDFFLQNPHLDLKDFLNEIALENQNDEYSNDAISMMSIHSSKGLEFKHLFIIGLEEGFFPIIGDGTDLEEERRLGYVAFTRAMDNLTLSFVHSRFYKGKRTQLNKSRFLVESGLVKGSLVIEKTSGFKKGDMVSHKIFGQGRVEKAVNAGKDYKLTINFGGQKRDILSSFVEKN